MSSRAAFRIAIGVWAFSLALTVAAAVFFALSYRTDVTGTEPGVDVFFLSASAVVFSAVGALVASRRPRNAIGWLLLVIGLVASLTAFSGGYATYGLIAHPGSLPATTAVIAVGLPGTFVTFMLVGTFLLLLFPDGHLLSRRWRPVAWLSGAVIAAAAWLTILSPGPFEVVPEIDNPLGLGGSTGSAIEAANNFPILPGMLCVTLSMASLVVRFRRSSGVERQQLKWVAAGGAFLAACLLSGPLLFWWTPFDGVWDVLAPLGFVVFPVAVGFAVLRYRMYDIDRIINRTVVYAIVTALLAGLYFGIVIGLQAAFGGLARGNDLAIAGSTLAVAALFRPARTRIQEFVDRRFYRRRYDAQQTLTPSAPGSGTRSISIRSQRSRRRRRRHDATQARLALAEGSAVTTRRHAC